MATDATITEVQGLIVQYVDGLVQLSDYTVGPSGSDD